jgi:beta-hydroxylase
VLAALQPPLSTSTSGGDRLAFRRQITDHSTFIAPYNCLVYLFSAVENRPILDVADFPALAPLRENWRPSATKRCDHDAGHIRASTATTSASTPSSARDGSAST